MFSRGVRIVDRGGQCDIVLKMCLYAGGEALKRGLAHFHGRRKRNSYGRLRGDSFI